MANAVDYIIGLSSLVLRACAYVFLRWIPGHPFPPIIFASFVAYILSAVPRFLSTKPYKVISDEIDIITKQTVGRHDVEDLDEDLIVDEVNEPLEEIDVEETIVLEEKEPKILRTLLTGIPSPSSLFWSLVTALINIGLVCMVVDLTYSGTWFHPNHDLSMARLGYVSDTTAKILIREPYAAQYPVFLSYRNADTRLRGGYGFDDSWKSAGSIAWLDNSTDYTGTFEITGLKPDTRYQWAVSTNHSGHLVTAPRPGHTSPSQGDSFTFLHSSCIKPHFPYNPFEHTLSIPGLRHLAVALPKLGAQFMLFLGDFIYIDVPHRFGTDRESYRREYRQAYASPDWPSVSSSHAGTTGYDLPWIHVLDDHEIANDWDRNTTGLYPAASDPWTHYHASVNPPPVRSDASYFSFTQGPATFFMLDTRRYRDPFDSTNGTWTSESQKSMLGTTQRTDLLSWLSRSEPTGVRWKILISSIPFTKNWRFGSEDTWAGYLGERQVILEAMWDVGLSGGVGVVVLSGDRHEFAATAFPPPAEGKIEEGVVSALQQGLGLGKPVKKWPLSATVHEFSASPLSMFYLPIRTYRQDDEEDVCIKYIPDGNSKFGAVSLSTPTASDQSVLHYRLFVDGQEAWSYTLTTPPDVRGGGRGKDAIWG